MENIESYGIYKMAWLMDNFDSIFYLQELDNSYLIDYSSEEEELIQKAKMRLDNKNTALNYIYQVEQKILEKGLILPLHYAQ